MSFSNNFIKGMMFSGFYITSYLLNCETLWFDPLYDSWDDPLYDPLHNNESFDYDKTAYYPILNLWKKQTVLFFDDLHESKNVRRILKNYELRINYDFKTILNNIIDYHGNIWITPPFQKALIELSKQNGKTKALSFEVYKNGELKAGEIGIKTGKIYTSYSGFYNESSAGSVQLLMMLKYLRDNDYAFCNFGTDDSEKNNAYKKKLGAVYIDRNDFIEIWRKGRNL